MSLKKLGTKIRARRLKAKVSIRALAERVKISKSHLFLVEIGDRNPSDELLAALCAELGIDLDEAQMLRGTVPSDVTRFLAKQPKLVRKIRREMTA